MTIIIGSARINERGKISGGKVGDQKQTSSINDRKGEVSMQDFYVHSKGWYILRPKSVTHANKMAKLMKTACNNPNLGYDQENRLGALRHGVDTNVKTECDCSGLVRACIKEATGKDVGNFTTYNEASTLESSDLFKDKIAFVSLTKTPVYNGDVLVTKTKGHTVIVVSGNPRPTSTLIDNYTGTFPVLPPRGYYKLGDGYVTLTNYPTQIKRVQKFLNWCIGSRLEVNGKYEQSTKQAVIEYQKKYNLTADGEFGTKSLAKAKTIKK